MWQFSRINAGAKEVYIQPHRNNPDYIAKVDLSSYKPAQIRDILRNWHRLNKNMVFLNGCGKISNGYTAEKKDYFPIGIWSIIEEGLTQTETDTRSNFYYLIAKFSFNYRDLLKERMSMYIQQNNSLPKPEADKFADNLIETSLLLYKDAQIQSAKIYRYFKAYNKKLIPKKVARCINALMESMNDFAQDKLLYFFARFMAEKYPDMMNALKLKANTQIQKNEKWTRLFSAPSLESNSPWIIDESGYLVLNAEKKKELLQLIEQIKKLKAEQKITEGFCGGLPRNFSNEKPGFANWMQCCVGEKSNRSSSEAFRVYLMVDLDQIPRAVNFLLQSGGKMQFKFLTGVTVTQDVISWSSQNYQSHGQQGLENYLIGRYYSFESGDPVIAVYFDGAEQANAFMQKLSKNPAWLQIERERCERNHFSRRRGTSSYIEGPNEWRTIGSNFVGGQIRPGYSEDLLRQLNVGDTNNQTSIQWQNYAEGTPTVYFDS